LKDLYLIESLQIKLMVSSLIEMKHNSIIIKI
jgi:hypothetical protein